MFKLFGSKVLFSSAKRIITGDACSKVIVETAVEVGRVASITLGPMGRNVLIENEKHEARITKDGVTVVKHIEYVELKKCRRTDSRMQFVPSSNSPSTRPTNSQETELLHLL